MIKEGFQVAVDTGGTFTDVLSSDANGTLTSSKSFTTPSDLSIGIMNALRQLAEKENGTGLKEFLNKTESIRIGTSVASNAIVNPPNPVTSTSVAMLNTNGFTDILEQRRLPKRDLYNWKQPKPVILIPRYMRFGVEERIKYTGEIITPLDEDSAREAVRKAKANGAEIITICLLHSYINPTHEQKLAKIVREEYPEATIFLSSEVWPHIVEFSRCITTAVGAYLTPIVEGFLNKLQNDLKTNGFNGELLLMTQEAELVPAEKAIDHAWTVVCSSQTSATLAGLSLGKTYDIQNAMLIDMGGTSFNVSAFANKAVPMSTNTRIGDQLIASECVDVEALGGGGGSVAWVDERGILRIGPDTVGSDPGPACYGKGGDRATITDADVVLGYIPTDNFLGGEMTIHNDLARQVIDKQIAQPLGVNVIEAASSIRRLFDNFMANQAFLSMLERGYSVSDFTLFVTGGAGPTHAFDLAAKLGLSQIHIPKAASMSGSLGILNADFIFHYTEPLFQIESSLDVAHMAKAYQKMEVEAVKMLESKNVAKKNISIIKGAYMRLYGQASELKVNLTETAAGVPFTDDTVKDLVEAFHRTHQEKRGFSDKTLVTYVHNLTLTALGKGGNVKTSTKSYSNSDPSKALKNQRDVFFKGLGGFTKTKCFDGSKLESGNIIPGPAVIEEKTTTIVVPPNAQVTVDKFGNYIGKL